VDRNVSGKKGIFLILFLCWHNILIKYNNWTIALKLRKVSQFKYCIDKKKRIKIMEYYLRIKTSLVKYSLRLIIIALFYYEIVTFKWSDQNIKRTYMDNSTITYLIIKLILLLSNQKKLHLLPFYSSQIQ
jgi:hypothetical protein